jgi:hypothetical protein
MNIDETVFTISEYIISIGSAQLFSTNIIESLCYHFLRSYSRIHFILLQQKILSKFQTSARHMVFTEGIPFLFILAVLYSIQIMFTESFF